MKYFRSVSRVMAISLIAVVVDFIFHSVRAADPNVLSVVDISTPTQSGYAIYWPSGLGNVSLQRATDNGTFTTITQTDQHNYVDYDVKPNVSYTYKVGSFIASAASDSVGVPQISQIKVEPGAVSKTEASVIVSFATDKLAKSQLFYGETGAYGNQTDLDSSLNQSHTVLIEKLKSGTTYHIKIKVQDKTDKNYSESDDQTFTTPAPPLDQSILEVIIRALTQAFSGFNKWFKS